MKTYLIQRDGSACCDLYAICNALRFFGRTTPEPGSRAWERLVDEIACRHGGALRTRVVADRLGLWLRPIEPDFREVVTNVPVMLTVLMDARRERLPTLDGGFSPTAWHGDAHSVLVVGGGRSSGRWTLDLVNYRSSRLIPQHVLWARLPMPERGHGMRGAMAITLKTSGAARTTAPKVAPKGHF